MINALKKFSRPMEEAILGPDQLRELWGLPPTSEITICELPDGSAGVSVRWRAESASEPSTAPVEPPAGPGKGPEKKATPGRDPATLGAPRPPQDGAP